MLRALRVPAIVAGLVLLILAALNAGAVAPGNEHFQARWERTDQPIISGTVSRTWIWGPEANTPPMQEPYAESPNGTRTVQYYDKSRMEINNPAGDPESLFYVTNGLLVVELMTGHLQRGDNAFESHNPAIVNVAGDSDDPEGPTYATMALVRNAPPVSDGAVITQRITRAGVVSYDPTLTTQGVTAAYHVIVPGLDHQVASPFWAFMISSGTVYENGAYLTEALFENPFYATGYPITEAYWANVKVAGSFRDVLMQCFERRCLTYTPGNPPGFATEAGNVGQHYWTWRYIQIPAETGPTPTSMGSASATGTTRSTEPATATGPTVTASATGTATSTTTVTASSNATPSTIPSVPIEYVYSSQFGGGPGDPAGTSMLQPRGIASNLRGNRIYLVDYELDRVQVYTPFGAFITQWGESGSGPGQFNGPHDIALDSDGNVYVVEALGNRVQKFDAEGNYITHWGGTGIAAAGFSFPGGIAISPAGVVYVSEFARVVMFDTDGALIDEFGSSGAGPGQFSNAIDVAVALDGTVYVVDKNNDRIQMFDADGVFLNQWGESGDGEAQFSDPTSIAVDNNGDVWVVDAGNHRIQVFDAAGVFIEEFGEPGTADDQLDEPFGIAVDLFGAYITDHSATNPGVKLHSGDEFVITWHDDSLDKLDNPIGIDIESSRGINIIVADTGHNRIAVFAGAGEYSISWDGSHNAAGPLVNPAGVAVGPAFAFLVTEGTANRFRIATSLSGDSVVVGGSGTGPGQFLHPFGIAYDTMGNIYVSDSERNVIQKFDPYGVFLDVWGEPGTGDGQLDRPTGIAIFENTIYVVDSDNARIQSFSLNGTYLGQFGTLGVGPGEFNNPSDIAVDTEGNLFVVDRGNDRIEKFTPDGQWLTSFGEPGEGDGQFILAVGIAVDSAGHVYVTDSELNRVMVFQPME